MPPAHTHIPCACRTQPWLGPLSCLPSVTENSRAVMPITPLPSLLNFSSLWEAISCDSQFIHSQHSSSCVISSQNGQGRLQPFLLLILFLKLLNHSSQGLSVSSCWYLAAFRHLSWAGSHASLTLAFIFRSTPSISHCRVSVLLMPWHPSLKIHFVLHSAVLAKPRARIHTLCKPVAVLAHKHTIHYASNTPPQSGCLQPGQL